MAGLQVRIHLMLGVAAPILVQAVDFGIHMVADILDWAGRAVPDPIRPALIDVIAVAEDEIQVGLRRNVAMGGEIALLIMLAADRGEAKASNIRTSRRERACPARQAALTPGRETVPIWPRRLEPRHFDVDAVAEFRPGDCGPLLHDGREPVVGRDLPLHLDRGGRHAVADLQRLRRESGPDYEAVGLRITSRNAELKREDAEDGLGERFPAEQRHGGKRAEPTGHAQQVAARQSITMFEDAAHRRETFPCGEAN
jgi:hypothetical protein